MTGCDDQVAMIFVYQTTILVAAGEQFPRDAAATRRRGRGRGRRASGARRVAPRGGATEATAARPGDDVLYRRGRAAPHQTSE